MTPMVDIVFLLIVFFMLVAELTRARGLDLDLSQLTDDVADLLSADTRIVVHVVPEDREGAVGGAYRYDGQSFLNQQRSLQSLAAALRSDLDQRAPDTPVFIRADRAERYERVHPILLAAARARAPRIEFIVDGQPTGAAP